MRRECGITGTGPTAVTGQTGQLEKVVNWVADAWNDIQMRNIHWRWMRCGFTFNTSASDGTYAYTDVTDTKTSAVIARFARWWADDASAPFKCYLTSAGVSAQYRLEYIPYENFKYHYKFGAQQSLTGRPVHVSVDDDDQIVIGPNPDAIYTITGDFQRGPQTLTADGTTPDMPSRFHDLIVYYGMQRYAGASIAPEVMAIADLQVSRLMPALEQSQLPQVSFGETLA